MAKASLLCSPIQASNTLPACTRWEKERHKFQQHMAHIFNLKAIPYQIFLLHRLLLLFNEIFQEKSSASYIF